MTSRVPGIAIGAAAALVLAFAGGSAGATAAPSVGAGADAAAAARRAAPRPEPHPPTFQFTRVRRPIVPVLVEAGGASVAGRVRDARVAVYDVSGRRPRRVGAGRTGSRGVALIRLRSARAPRAMRVVAVGGRVYGRRFGGTLLARLRYRAPHAVYVTPPSTLVARDQLRHPRRSLRRSRAVVRRILGLPRFFDFAGDLAYGELFDGRRFLRVASRHGGFDRHVRALVRRGARGRRAAARAATASGACWNAAAQTTAGFAAFLGFGGSGATSPCTSVSASAARASSGTPAARAAALGPNDVFSDVIGVASFAYSLFSGQSSSSQMARIESQLTAIQTTLTDIQAQLGGLQSQVEAVNADVVEGNATALIADAQPTITAIKTATADVNALVGDAYQVICDPTANCTRATGYGNFGAAMDAICDDWTAACNTFYSALYSTHLALRDDLPVQAVENLGGWALGSGFSGGPLSAGIVQYSLQAGAGSQQFFQTADAAPARLQWAYYTLYSTMAQSTYALALSMGIGQRLPGATSAHAPSLSTQNVLNQVSKMDASIDLFMGAFPNMPDTAVIDTNLGGTDGDAPYLFAQQVGGMASIGAYQDGARLTMSPAAVQAGQLPFTGGSGMLSTLQTDGAPPVVMTPAAADGDTWQLLPAGGTTPPQPPQMTVAPFSDWTVASATASGTTPEWDSGSQTVSAANGGLSGALADLYTGAAPASGQTPGQWMIAQSGIDSGLLTPANTGYGDTSQPGGFAGAVPYFAKSGSDSSDPGLGFTGCTPAGDTQCLLPTWQSTAIDPYGQVSSGAAYNTSSTPSNTGLFDFNNGVVIANQQGHDANGDPGFSTSLPGNPGTFLNQYPNWSSATAIRGVNFNGFLDALNGVAQGGLANAGFSSLGRPVLFNRQQTPNDCFFWTGATSANAPAGTGCLTARTTSGEILP